MIEKYWFDHLYRYIEIDDDTLNFINHPPIRKIFARLSNISQLGIASKIFPSATHKKLHHNLGVYYLANYLLSEADLPSDVINKLSFKIAAIVHGIGHFPFSFATEVALQKASFLNKGVEDFIIERIQPVVDRVTKDCTPKEKRKFNKEIFKEYSNINYFYRFFTASLLLENEKELREITKDYDCFNFDELLKYLAFKQSMGFKLLHHIDRLDYLLRDMLHLGFIKIDLNLSFYFKDLKVTNKKEIKLPLEWKVLDKLESYAVEKIYNDPRVKAIEALYQKAFTKAIFDSEIAFAELLEWEDKDIETRIKEYQKKRKHKYQVFEQIDQIKSEFDSLITYSLSESNERSSARNLLLAEGMVKSIGNTLRKDIDRSVENGLFKGSYVSSFDYLSDIHVNLVGLDKKEMPRFLKEITKYENHYKRNNKKQIAKCIWGKHFYKIDFDRYKPVVKCLIEKIQREKGFNPIDIFIKVMSMSSEYSPKGIAPQEFTQMMATLLKFTETMDKKKGGAHSIYNTIVDGLLMNPEALLLDKNLLSSFSFSNARKFLSFIKPICNKRIKKITNFKGKALEYYTYLNKVCDPKKREDQIKKWVFPSTLTDRGEIDVWNLEVFKNRRPLLELIECSISSSSSKKLTDVNKLKKNRSILQERFDKKIEIKMFFNDQEISE